MELKIRVEHIQKSVLLFFNRLMKDLFWIVLCSSYDMIITFGENRMDQARLCDMQISYKMVSNVHVRQLTVSLIN